MTVIAPLDTNYTIGRFRKIEIGKLKLSQICVGQQQKSLHSLSMISDYKYIIIIIIYQDPLVIIIIITIIIITMKTYCSIGRSHISEKVLCSTVGLLSITSWA